MRHLLIDISGHGFGHLAQILPILKEINSRKINVNITIRSSLNEQLLRSKIDSEFVYLNTELDKGMIMHDAMKVNKEASYTWYKQFHDQYEKKLHEQVEILDTLKPDLLLADVPYISIEAAHLLNIPSIALCSLNWADIFYTYCKQYSKSDDIYQQILAAYNKANAFLQPIPSMDMPLINNGVIIGPICQQGTPQELSKFIKKTNKEKFILVSLGGIDTNFRVDNLPTLESVNWIVPDAMSSIRNDVFCQSLFPISYVDLLSSVNLILTKTGYGTLVEAIKHEIPVLCIERPDWPEEPNLFSWCKKHGYFKSLKTHQLNTKYLTDQVMSMLEIKWDKTSIDENGAQQATDIICDYLV